MSKLKIISNESEFEELIKYCKQTGYASIDYETTDSHFADPVQLPTIIGVSFQIGSAWILPLAHYQSPFKHCWKRLLKKFFKEVIENPNIVKIAWNFKFEYKWSYRFGGIFKGILMDGMLAKYLLDEEPPNDLKSIVRMYYPEYADYELSIKGRKWAEIPLDELSKYCGIDCDMTFRIMMALERKLIKHGFYNLFRNLLMMMTRVLAESEYYGTLVDREYLVNLSHQYQSKIAGVYNDLINNPFILKYERKYKREHIKNLIEGVKLEIEGIQEKGEKNAATLIRNREKKIQNILEGKFTNKDRYDGINFGSPTQMAELLYISKFGYKFKPTKYTDSGKPSTDEETLLKLKEKDKYGFIETLLKHRGLLKLDSTYITGMIPHLDINNRLHPGYKIHGTVTGRLSCVEPNLQNIPRGVTASDIKKMFIPPKGKVIAEIDYSQAELRVVAELANDKAMIEIFRLNYNIHTATACKINKCLDRYDEIKKILKDENHKDWLFWTKEKKKAKTINFGILYGQGAPQLAEGMGVSIEEAKAFIKAWYKEYPQVTQYIKDQKWLAHKQGYVTSIFGRKRRLHDIYSDAPFFVAQAEREAVNAPIQAAASDFTQLSSIVIREKKRIGEFPRDMQQCWTVHDSIGFYMWPEEVNIYLPKIVEICANPNTLEYFRFELDKVRMKVSPEVGESWYDLEEWDPKIDYVEKFKHLKA